MKKTARKAAAKAAPGRKAATKATGVTAAGGITAAAVVGADDAVPQAEETASARTDTSPAEQATEPTPAEATPTPTLAGPTPTPNAAEPTPVEPPPTPNAAEPTLPPNAAAQTGADPSDPTEPDPSRPGSVETTRPEPAPGKPTPTAPEPRPQTAPEPAPLDAIEAGLVGRTPDLRMLVSRLLEHPGYAPELLALTAVEALGPGAAAWARRLRQRYPEADGDGLARLADRRFVRQAGVGGATAALAGVFAPVVELVAVLWTQASLVLHLAAAYGRDPADPERAVELLVLAQVHPDEASARSALAAARTADGPGEQPGPRAAEAAWRLAAPLAAQAGGWLALRWASRLLPGAAVVTAAVGDSAAAQRLSSRAVAAYRPTRRR
ncbi:hypothetical protein ABZ738_26790 [Micromonospora sp. NPDC047793]|uniref:hypothetical protein n=1 Tax=Micromonospora sp. NPDC047793 TaxID=3154342 RepID=UPI0033C34D52